MSERLAKYMACSHKNVQQYTECCLDCGENIYTKPAEILRQEAQEKARKEDDNWNEQGW